MSLANSLPNLVSCHHQQQKEYLSPFPISAAHQVAQHLLVFYFVCNKVHPGLLFFRSSVYLFAYSFT